MLVRAPRAYKRHNFPLWLDNNLTGRLCRTSMGRICLAVRTQNESESVLSKGSDVQVPFEGQQITAECKM